MIICIVHMPQHDQRHICMHASTLLLQPYMQFPPTHTAQNTSGSSKQLFGGLTLRQQPALASCKHGMVQQSRALSHSHQAAVLTAHGIGITIQHCDWLHVQLWLGCLSQVVAGHECTRGKGDASGFSAEAQSGGSGGTISHYLHMGRHNPEDHPGSGTRRAHLCGGTFNSTVVF